MSNKKNTDPYDLVAQALNCEKSSLTSDSGLSRHPDWDSFGQLSIILAMETEYCVKINDEAITRFTSMQAILQFYCEISE